MCSGRFNTNDNVTSLSRRLLITVVQLQICSICIIQTHFMTVVVCVNSPAPCASPMVLLHTGRGAADFGRKQTKTSPVPPCRHFQATVFALFSWMFVPYTAAELHTPTLVQILVTVYKPSGELFNAVVARCKMAKSNNLKIILECSLNEIFKATVNDILESVDRTLSAYQGTIQRIESENEDLKRLLFAQSGAETTARGKVFHTRPIT